MEVITSKERLQTKMLDHRKKQKTIGFVPTMGLLHDGHLRLARHSVQDNDITVMSIFVNPLQFGPGEDFDSYPRNHERDKILAEQAGVDYLFIPDQNDIYDRNPSFQISVTKRTNVLCGKSRPGHFDGVATILMKLFHIAMPHQVYFGLKDAQQVAVVESLIHDFDFPIRLNAIETVREQDGLAKSSRNVYLTAEERAQAPALLKSLQLGKQAVCNGIRDSQTIIRIVKDYLQQQVSGTIDYIDVLSFPELEELEKLQGKIIIALAVKFSKARLIDNIIITIDE